MNKEINQLAIEIYYAQGKGVDISVDDWIEKIEKLLEAQKQDLLKKIEGMKKRKGKDIGKYKWEERKCEYNEALEDIKQLLK